jgi:hypothetical protein
MSSPFAMPVVKSFDTNKRTSKQKHKQVNHINKPWLVVSSPLKNISRMGLLFPIWGKLKNVPNHQPDINKPYQQDYQWTQRKCP